MSGIPAVLTGHFCIHGQAAGAENNLEHIPWVMSHQGGVHVELPSGHEEYLRKIESFLAGLRDAPLRPGSDPMWRQVITDYLQQKCPDLQPQVQLVVTNDSAGVWVRLGLSLSDWPSLELGPARMTDPDQVPEVIDRLLSLTSLPAALRLM